MKTRIYIITLLSAISIAVKAQTFQPATIDNNVFQSHQIMQTGSYYNGQIYEPFSNAIPSEQSTVGASSSPAIVSRPRKAFDTGGEAGRAEEYPIGDAILPLMAFALIACGVIYRRHKSA